MEKEGGGIRSGRGGGRGAENREYGMRKLPKGHEVG